MAMMHASATASRANLAKALPSPLHAKAPSSIMNSTGRPKSAVAARPSAGSKKLKSPKKKGVGSRYDQERTIMENPELVEEPANLEVDAPQQRHDEAIADLQVPSAQALLQTQQPRRSFEGNLQLQAETERLVEEVEKGIHSLVER
jgi:hypothetical protein